MGTPSRRHRLGLVAIAVAALASAATGALPSPTPELTSTETGTLTLTAEAPVAWLDFSPVANDDLVAADGRTVLRVSGQALDVGVVLRVGDPTTGEGGRSFGVGSVTKEASCEAGEVCGATLRLVAFLIDPVAHPTVDVTWTATAEARFPASGGPVPKAALDVKVGAVESRPAAELSLASRGPETVKVGPDVPRAVRTVHLTLPADAAADWPFEPALLIRLTDLGGGPAWQPPVKVRFLRGSNDSEVTWPAELVSPFSGCAPATPCETDVAIQFDWNGGSAEGTSVEWSLAAWAGRSGGNATDVAAIDAPVAADIAWEDPVKATTSGQTKVTRSGGSRVEFSTLLDMSDVAQGDGVEGLVRLVLHASLAADVDPAAEIMFSVGESPDFITVRPGVRSGETIAVYSRAETLVCAGRSTCPVKFSVNMTRDSSDLPEATVEWVADVEFMPLNGHRLADAAELRISGEQTIP